MRAGAGWPAALLAGAAWGQVPPVAALPAPAAAASAPPTALQPVQVDAVRASDTELRRRSTAAKIVVGRDEIERYGDSTLGDVLKGLPGVTLQGRPGRGGAIRMRGLGNGYTQILLDGDRVPPGFSLDSLAPEQIERIEILRAPTAETGARAIAGTINIVTREGTVRRINDLKLSAGFENDHLQPAASWTRNDVAGAWTINHSLTVFSQQRRSDSATSTVQTDPASGAVLLDQREATTVHDRRQGLHGSGRLQWRSADGGDVATVLPVVVLSAGSSRRSAALVQSAGSLPAPYDAADSEARNQYALLRLNGQWNHRLGEGARLEWHGGLGQGRNASRSERRESAGGVPQRLLQDESQTRDRHLSGSVKLTRLLDGEHSLVAGAEAEASRRDERRTTLQDGAPLLADFGENLRARSSRLALYAQDEWSVTPQWAAHAGLRWEGITTQGGGAGATLEGSASNRSSVWTPLLHAVWKPEPQSRDQLRLSLTRSYRSPALSSLIARPGLNSRYPAPGPNTPTEPDRAGNPTLRPELATGIDIALERYLRGGGLLSANVFQRRISDFMRSRTALEAVPWADRPRWVSRPQNVGRARTQGLELEAKFRLSEVWEAAPRVDLRSNASFFRSRVDGVPGPDNRLDQQPDHSLNLGADYRLASLPLTIGGNLNRIPAYATRLSESQTAFQGARSVVDAYALWVFGPALQLRVTASNLTARADVTGGSVGDELARTTAPSYLNLQLRLELKL